MKLCKIISMSSGGNLYLPKEAREHLDLGEGQPAKLAVFLGEDEGGKFVALRVVR